MPGASDTQRGNEIFAMILYLPLVAVPNVAANATANQTVTVTGVISGDLISWNQLSNIVGLAVENVYVSSANTLTFNWSNATIAAINGSASQPFLLEVTRSSNAAVTGLSGLPSVVG